eukprot:5903585-Pleurochrysis_carterae.AAC.1
MTLLKALSLLLLVQTAIKRLNACTRPQMPARWGATLSRTLTPRAVSNSLQRKAFACGIPKNARCT